MIAHAKWDFSAACATSIHLFYVLFPASNTSALLIRRFVLYQEQDIKALRKFWKFLHADVADWESQRSCYSLQCCRFACREEIHSAATEEPEPALVTPAAQTAVRSLLGSMPCPVFSPLDYSNNSSKLLQVQHLGYCSISVLRALDCTCRAAAFQAEWMLMEYLVLRE